MLINEENLRQLLVAYSAILCDLHDAKLRGIAKCTFHKSL